MQLCESFPPPGCELSPQLHVPVTVTTTGPEVPETYFQVALVESGSPAFAAAVEAATSAAATTAASASHRRAGATAHASLSMFSPVSSFRAPVALAAETH